MPSAHFLDRRAHLRFQVVGTMVGTLLSMDTLTVLNFGTSGALVEGAVPLPPDGEYRMQLVLESQVSDAVVKVRRVTAVGGGAGSVRYHMGLEFLAISPDAEEAITKLIMTNEAKA